MTLRLIFILIKTESRFMFLLVTKEKVKKNLYPITERKLFF